MAERLARQPKTANPVAPAARRGQAAIPAAVPNQPVAQANSVGSCIASNWHPTCHHDRTLVPAWLCQLDSICLVRNGACGIAAPAEPVLLRVSGGHRWHGEWVVSNRGISRWAHIYRLRLQFGWAGFAGQAHTLRYVSVPIPPPSNTP